MTDRPTTETVGSASMSGGGGGSAAAQAYRQQLTQEGRSLDAAAPVAATAPPAAQAAVQAGSIEARAAERKKVPGRVRVLLSGGTLVVGKMVDISLTGACIMLDDVFPSKRTCTLECDIFYMGTRHLFNAPAVSVYGILVAGKGFKVGFQFGPISEVTRKSIAALVK
jgi:PilZ domain